MITIPPKGDFIVDDKILTDKPQILSVIGKRNGK